MSSTKSKERQFQVVPVPAVFTRGRWECIDYKGTGASPWPCPPLPSDSSNINDKIEQAMDLVKTHLTFAVREEVESLRATIADLEGRVTLLEGENQILRQYAPAEILSNLPALVQQQQHQREQQQKVAAAAAGGANATMAGKLNIMQTVPSAPVIMDPHQQQYHQPALIQSPPQQQEYTSPKN